MIYKYIELLYQSYLKNIIRKIKRFIINYESNLNVEYY